MSKKVLVISGTISPKDKSYSWELSKKFIEEYTKNNPKDELIYLDLNHVPMAQKSLTEQNFATYFNEEDAMKYIQQLREVDKIVISSPMHNFNVPGIVKNYLDHILLANETFSYKYSKKGDAIGLLTNLTVQILTTQGAPFGWYMWGNHTDYLRGTWEFVGAKVVEPILLAGTKVSGLTPTQAVDNIVEDITEAAKKF
ncbi:FMN-dependent NADH-azoreductase [Williamsoniiplasma somnilux]|uniref:FMN dependent NADH:quinone oxidoreductase n=1 Tax=Williamsoniiplasma somnilux TaxID=215578 RepID=A0A2K8P157_9MOLU|nr:FMN-dependent NADH-azoreductase [Williamsoniiplasma somnilux]ATZ18633.1 FMN-dependent NADH-azoreductase [Williamsoniiplasma somnilux]